MEVENLEAGGNRVAKKHWMARFGADEKIPTSGNTEEIKEFVRRCRYRDGSAPTLTAEAGRTQVRGACVAGQGEEEAQGEGAENGELCSIHVFISATLPY